VSLFEVAMRMPSLFKYFAFVGGCLLGLLTLINFLLEPSTGATSVSAAQAKPPLTVQYDPRASKIERWRVEQAALKAAEQIQTGENASLVAKSTAQPARHAPVTAAAVAQPAQTAPTQASYQPAAAQPPQTEQPDTVAAPAEADHAAKLAEQKAKLAKAKVRKTKLARERAATRNATAFSAARERAASNQQDRVRPDMAEHHCIVREMGKVEAIGQIGAARRGCSFGHSSVLPILNITSYVAAAYSPVSSCERERRQR